MFEQISTKLQGAFKKLRGQARLKEEHVDSALKEIRLALLEADVQYGVARDFVKRVRDQAVGEEILGSLTGLKTSRTLSQRVRDTNEKFSALFAISRVF